MLHKFLGVEPETFPTVQFQTIDGDPHDPLLEPGEVVDVVAVDGNPDGLVIHPRLVSTDAPPVPPTVPETAPTDEVQP